MQTEQSKLAEKSEKSLTKWILTAAIITFLIFSTVLFIALKTQYIEVNFCVAAVNCSQSPSQITDHAQIDIAEVPLEDANKVYQPTKITVKPLAIGAVAGVVSSGTIAALIALNFISLPMELALAIGALIGYGTYFALKQLY